MTEQMPQDSVVALRQVITAFGHDAAAWPTWFTDLERTKHWNGWITMLTTAANDLESMQKLNGKLYRTLYPD